MPSLSPVSTPPAAPKLPSRLDGLDALRFWAACWVVLFHIGGPPLTEGHDVHSKVAWALNGFYHGSINGPAAVIVFFLVSGLCIHFSFVGGRPMDIREFFTRRLTRLLLPMLAAIGLARLLGTATSRTDWLDGIPAWSLVAEIIYYLLYPALLALSRRVGWTRIFAVTFVAAFLFAFTRAWTNINYCAWGYGGDWVLGLPCWLLGVLLAERLPVLLAAPSLRPSEMWTWRLGAIALGAIAQNLALQLIIGHHLTLNFFAIYAYFWLGREIRYYQSHPAPRRFEALGAASYSLYLTHEILSLSLYHLQPPNLGLGANWLLLIAFIFGGSLLFYVAVERPSHRLARALAQTVARRSMRA